MTLRVNQSFANTLAASTATNQVWSTAFKNGLGANRRVICKWVADSSMPQDEVYANGATFRNAALSGEMTIVGGIITSYGATSDLTIATAADLSQGVAVLRIEGNGNWIEGTIGLVGSDCDFVLPANPTTTNSIAVSPNMRISPPPFLPSGTGYPPPALDADAPHYVIIDNWSDAANVVEAGRIYFNRRIKNWVFEDAEYAQNIGDVRVTQSNDSVVLGDMEFGAMLISTDTAVGSVNGKVLHQVLVNYKPTPENWPAYPRETNPTNGGYRRGTRDIGVAVGVDYGLSNTFAGPHKVRIFTADNRLLGTIEMRDGLPINSPELSEVPTLTKAIRPHVHCATLLMWQSHEPKLNSYAKKYYPGTEKRHFMRASIGKERTNVNAAYPLYSISQATDSFGQWYALPKWALPCNIDAVTADKATRQDPYLWSIGPGDGASSNPWETPSWANFYNVPSSDYGSLTIAKVVIMGWGYEPGAWACHDQFAGPGGRRVDRGGIPTPIAIHLTDPTSVHMRGNTPIAEMVKHWNMAYFNHAIHYFTDVKTFDTIPTQEVVDGKWAHSDVYYNGGAIFTDREHSIPQFSIGSSPGGIAGSPHSSAYTDSNYRMPWNGHSIDYYHNYSAPGWAALLYNSPAHAVSAKHRYFASIMCQGSNVGPNKLHNSFLMRSFGWQLLQDALMWKLASDHPLGVTKAQVEARLEEGLNSVYDNWYVPLYVTNSQTLEMRSVRNLGIRVQYWSSGPAWGPSSWTLHYYAAHALQAWRQFGLWKVMYNKSQKCRDALLLLIKMLDKAAIEYYLDTDGRWQGSVYNEGVNLFVGDRTSTTESNIVVATDWADWSVRVCPKASPAEDLVHKTDGTLRKPDIGEYSRMQWPFIRRDYFPDVPAERDVGACCTKVQGWIDAWTTHIEGMEAQGASPRTLAVEDWSPFPSLGKILPPTVLEP